MSLDAWIVTSFGVAFSILISIAAYFIKLWIQEVDGNLKEHGKDIKAISKQISALEQTQDSKAKNISEAIRKEYSSARIPFERLDGLQAEISGVKHELSVTRDTLVNRVVPTMEKANESFGKIIFIEKRVNDQEVKLVKLFEILKAAIIKPSQNQKSGQE